jgi:hypothetical protein
MVGWFSFCGSDFLASCELASPSQGAPRRADANQGAAIGFIRGQYEC